MLLLLPIQLPSLERVEIGWRRTNIPKIWNRTRLLERSSRSTLRGRNRLRLLLLLL